MSSISQNANDAERQKNIFANCFWGKDDAGFEVLTTRLKQAKQTCEEIKNLFHERALIEEEYAKRLSKLSKIPFGKDEVGTLHDVLETVRQELETTAKEHIGLSQKIRAELEQELTDFIVKQREKRKMQQNTVETSLRNKQTQVSFAQKAREKYESECLKLPGLFESKKTAVGKDLEKLNSKIERTQLAAKAADQEYIQMVKIAADATQRWNEDWRLACEKFQYLEEDRIDFLKKELWNYANLISSICVVDDESCERIRLSLENCNADKDIQTFIKERATGPDIPDPPSYVNFYAGSGENGTRYRRASYERTSIERKNNILPPGTDQPMGNSQPMQNSSHNLISPANSSQSSQDNGMNYKSLYNFLPFEKSNRAYMYANTSSASPHGTIKNSALPRTPIEEVEEPDPIDPGQQTILAVGSNLLEVQATNENSNNISNIERSVEKALDDIQNKEKADEYGKVDEEEKENEDVKENKEEKENEEEKADEEKEEMLENNFKPNSSSPITKTIESQPTIPDDSNSIPLQATTQSPEAGSPLLTNIQHQEIQAHRQESMRALEGISSSQNSPKPLTSGPGDLRRQSSTPGIGSGSSQPNIQGPGDARRYFQSPNPNIPISEQVSRSSTIPPRKNSLINDHVSRSSTLRTASSSNSNNSIGIQLDARGRVKQDDMAEAYYDNRIPPQNMHYQQQMHPGGSPYNTIPSNTIPYGRGMPTTHMPTQNQLAMNNSSQDPRVSSPGSSTSVTRNISTRMRPQYPQQMYQNSGFYNNIPSYDPRQPPPQGYSNNSTFAAQRPNGTGVQRMDDGKQVLFLVKALYDYKTTSAEEIPFLANDVIAVLGINPDGWWEGELLDDSRKKRGLFPSNYIQVLE